jgi:PTS system nitrogen regulatory IIA component
MVNLNVKNKRHLFQEMSTRSSLLNKSINDKILFNEIVKRERLGNTCRGNGIAIPSAIIENIIKPFVLFSLLTKSINYNYDDKKDVDIVCLVVSPNSSTSKHLYFLSNFSRIIKNGNISNELRGCDTSDSLLAVLAHFNFSSAA